MTSFLPSGILLINKPVGPTSHDLVQALRRLINGPRVSGRALRSIKIGHAGTLDPFAQGLLICAIGREATKTIDQFKDLPKEYQAIFCLGATTDTYDKTGVVSCRAIVNQPTLETITSTLKQFIGPLEQIPPMFSAKKVGGQALYKLARAGKDIARQPNKIEIYKLELLDYVWPHLSLKINCSKGTYIRSLAFDLGEILQTGAYVEVLTRTAIGPYHLEQAVSLEQLTPDNWQQYLI